MNVVRISNVVPAGLFCAVLLSATAGCEAPKPIGYRNTPLIPGTKWKNKNWKLEDGAMSPTKGGQSTVDSYNNPTYPDGQAGAIYGQFPPMVNACRPPGQWQTYDITFVAPRFVDGALASPATVTVIHNGMTIHDNVSILGPTAHKRVGKYRPHGLKGSINLQHHGDPVRFRNIWIKPIGK
ncbi:MAG: DUF1080 domain-containing protein [Phycisphaerae bacterium]|jgi:hypothetical protein|nr:DUF1080 domain-containing protein [Phycisphaerae bacterium]